MEQIIYKIACMLLGILLMMLLGDPLIAPLVGVAIIIGWEFVTNRFFRK